MGLEDFERELAAGKEKDARKKRHRSRSRDRRDRHDRHDDRHDRHGHKHHHRDNGHRHKRSRHRETSEERARRKRREKERDKDHEKHHDESANASVQRDSWMQAPSAMDVDYVQRKKREEKSTFVSATEAQQPALHLHRAELNQRLQDADVINDGDDDSAEEPVQRSVPYTFGDAGSQWRMTKLKGVYRIAEDEGRPVEDVALEKYGNLRDFDDAREEETELDRRNMYGNDYVGKEKPSGELYEERRLKAGIHRPPRRPSSAELDLPQGQVIADPRPTTSTVRLSQTELNKLKAQMMKAKMKGAANAAELETQYNAAISGAANSLEPDVVVLNVMDNRMLAGGRKGEVKELTNKRGRERGLVVENDDMNIEDMVRQERRTRGQAGGEGMLLAEKIAKDAKFDNDLDYLDENATKLASRAPKSTVNLRNAAIADYQRTNRILDSCPLCHHEDKSPPQPPVAPIVSLATRVFLTLPTEPEISEGGAVIVPIQHRTNLLECDDDEWEEIRNFMKCLTRMYHDQGRDVVFYENAANPGRKLHAAMNAVPIPFELGETAPAFFREAILSSDSEWSQHKPIIDTLKASRSGQGKTAFRRSLAKEMPYFHVWFELDGGMGHVVEDERRWPRSDLFARETLGGMLDADIETIKRQGRWVKGDRRVDGFRKGWRKFDWTKVLTDG